tara:strand:+ start:536 stop:1003 length:468 start_codon:yes stop_codon:yes gene_type:complete
MNISHAGIELIKRFESIRLKAYPDPKTGGDPWTVGWGATGSGIGPDTIWTQAQCDMRLLDDIAEREKVIAKKVLTTTQGQFDAWVSILFNVGHGSPRRDGVIELKDGRPSTLLRKFNEGDIPGAEEQWLKWVSPGSSVTKGLTRRRQAELELFRS